MEEIIILMAKCDRALGALAYTYKKVYNLN
jgi:hypothetical protein